MLNADILWSFSSPADAFAARDCLKTLDIGFFTETVFSNSLSLICDAVAHGCNSSWQPTLKYLMSEALEPSNKFSVLMKVSKNFQSFQETVCSNNNHKLWI